jgi:hypothetical protein
MGRWSFRNPRYILRPSEPTWKERSKGMQKLRSPDVVRDLCLDRGCLLEALRNCVNENGMEHFQLASKLGVDLWTPLEWIKGTTRPNSASLLAIRHFLEEYAPKYLPVLEKEEKRERRQSEIASNMIVKRWACAWRTHNARNGNGQ